MKKYLFVRQLNLYLQIALIQIYLIFALNFVGKNEAIAFYSCFLKYPVSKHARVDRLKPCFIHGVGLSYLRARFWIYLESG